LGRSIATKFKTTERAMMSSQLAAIPTDKFALSEDVALHGLFRLGLCWRCFQRELRIERVQLEEITV
jgi:hypothetical protein